MIYSIPTVVKYLFILPGDTLLAIQAPSGTQLEVPIPEMVCSTAVIEMVCSIAVIQVKEKKKKSYCPKRDKCVFEPNKNFWNLNIFELLLLRYISKIIDI